MKFYEVLNNLSVEYEHLAREHYTPNIIKLGSMYFYQTDGEPEVISVV
jgi:hypothetical protein